MFEIVQGWDLSILNGLRSVHDSRVVWLAFVLAGLAWKGVLMWCLAAAFWFTGRRRLSVQIALALLMGVLEIGALKGIIQRPRPDLYASQQLNIPMPELLTTAHSFPSGHVTLAAAGVYVIAAACGGWAAFLGWLFVALVGIARVYQGLHWPSDIVGSVLLGVVSGALAIWISKLPAVNSFLRAGNEGKS